MVDLGSDWFAADQNLPLNHSFCAILWTPSDLIERLLTTWFTLYSRSWVLLGYDRRRDHSQRPLPDKLKLDDQRVLSWEKSLG